VGKWFAEKRNPFDPIPFEFLMRLTIGKIKAPLGKRILEVSPYHVSYSAALE
jgi:hypothetical protein